MVKNVNKSTIFSLIDNFKTSIIKYDNIEQLKSDLNIDIIGEVAKNLLNQSIEKKKQISKYIDIILMDKQIRQMEDKPPYLEENYRRLNLTIKNEKLLILFSDGSFLKLKDASNIIENHDIEDIAKNEELYNNRDVKNIKNLRKIISELSNKKIPYIIFYIGNYLPDNLDNLLIKYIKQKDMNNELKNKILQNEHE